MMQKELQHMDDYENMFHLIVLMVLLHVQVKYFLITNQLFHVLFQFQFFVQMIDEQHDIDNDDRFQLDDLFHIILLQK
jgi:hypothetical protein